MFRPGLRFAVPLRSEGFATGIVARSSATSGIILGYFFGPRRAGASSMSEVEVLKPDDAIWVSRFGYLGLKGGKWPLIGMQSDWDSRDWPMPKMRRYEELTGRTFEVTYNDSDPALALAEKQIEPGLACPIWEDGGAGSGFVELKLDGLL